MVEGDSHLEVPVSNVIQPWVTIERPGFSFRGRFMPQLEMDLEYLDTQLSVRPGISYEAWLVQISTLLIQTEINLQLGEFTIKKRSIQPLPISFTQIEEFQSVFNSNDAVDDIIQCAVVENKSNRSWVRLVGLGYDLQLWKADTRAATAPSHRTLEACGEQWLIDILQPWREKLLGSFGNPQLFVETENLATADHAVLVCSAPALTPGAPPMLKEIVAYRYPRVIHMFNVVEYGRRWYRTLVFSTDTALAFANIKMSMGNLDGLFVEVCGNILAETIPDLSLVIKRDVSSTSPKKQTFVPRRYLNGLIPQALVDVYNFWQNDDESLSGYMPLHSAKVSARSVLTVTLLKRGLPDASSFCNSGADALISRIYIQEMTSDQIDAEAAFCEDPDPSKPKLFLVNLLLVLSHVGRKAARLGAVTAPKHLQASKALFNFADESSTLHALIRMLLKLENISHILAWTTANPIVEGPLSIDLIELPRLGLTFVKRVAGDGKVRYFCQEQNGLFITGYKSDMKCASLMEGLPRSILLSNSDNELFVMMPAIAKPMLWKTRKGKDETVFTTSLSNQDWIANTGESTYFLYPIHTSGTFMSSRSVGSSLYLLVVLMMTRRYKEAFAVIESCVCDIPFTKQEQQIFDLIATVTDNLHVDLHACRLKMYFVTFGCSENMPYPFDVVDDMLNYTNRFKSVSAACKLAPEEEAFIISSLPIESQTRRDLNLLNRERLIRTSFTLTFADFSPKAADHLFSPQYPSLPQLASPNAEPIDWSLLDTDQPNASAWLKKISFGQFSPPEPAVGAQGVKFFLQAIEEDRKRPGFFVLYELMVNHVMVNLIPSDPPFQIGSILFFLVGNDTLTGVEHALLKVMSTNPALASKMPPFEDKRKIKLPKFTGLDVFQTHIKLAAGFVMDNMQDIDMTQVAVEKSSVYRPPPKVKAAPTHETPELLDGRCWLNPLVKDFSRSRQRISHERVPPIFTTFATYFTQAEVSFLVGTPLHSIDLRNYVEQKTLSDRGLEAVGSDSPLTVLEHPSSQSYIARVSVSRLEQDIKDFSGDENGSKVPILKAVNHKSDLRGQSLDQAIDRIQVQPQPCN